MTLNLILTLTSSFDLNSQLWPFTSSWLSHPPLVLTLNCDPYPYTILWTLYMTLDTNPITNSLIVFLATKHISTPLFVMVAQWDSYQLTWLVAGSYKSISLPPKKHKERAYLARFGNNTYRSLASVSIFSYLLAAIVATMPLFPTFVKRKVFICTKGAAIFNPGYQVGG